MTARVVVYSSLTLLVAGFSFFYFRTMPEWSVSVDNQALTFATSTKATTTPEIVVTHIPTPQSVKAIYMTSWVAGSVGFREKLIKLIEDTELNSIVIDIKDYTGRISFAVNDPLLKKVGAEQTRIKDIRALIALLHSKNIYVIGRLSAFQDPMLVKYSPQFAVERASDKAVWKDYKGISWMDAGATDVWHYLVTIGKESYENGFDEINFDYIRFPSDGNMNDIYYPESHGKKKADVLKSFFSYIHENLGGSGVVLSADLFGMTTTNHDDLNIGQVLENALPYFDYIAPMVYPSHYPKTFMGFSNPAEKPYEVVKYSMSKAVARAIEASTTPAKLRPWLQDFNLGAMYTPTKVRAQINAVYDSGLTSWMLWNASNVYTKAALLDPSGTTTVSFPTATP